MAQDALLCTLCVGDELFGIDSLKVQQVLGESEVQPVPLAPAFVGGMMAHRGEMLPVVCFRRLLGMPVIDGPVSVLVLRDDQTGELLGLAVDAILDVTRVLASEYEPNPCMLDARRARLFSGAYKNADQIVMVVAPDRLRPASLMDWLSPEGENECVS